MIVPSLVCVTCHPHPHICKSECHSLSWTARHSHHNPTQRGALSLVNILCSDWLISWCWYVSSLLMSRLPRFAYRTSSMRLKSFISKRMNFTRKCFNRTELFQSTYNLFLNKPLKCEPHVFTMFCSACHLTPVSVVSKFPETRPSVYNVYISSTIL